MDRDKLLQYDEAFNFLSLALKLVDSAAELRARAGQHHQQLAPLAASILNHAVSKAKAAIVYIDELDKSE